jgi:CBS domain containing-hemolysin-like protein
MEMTMPDGAEPSRLSAEADQASQKPKAQPPVETETPEPRPAEAARPRGLSRLFGWRRSDPAQDIASANGRDRKLSAAERAMIERVVALENVRVGDVAIPRADIIAIEITAGMSEALGSFAQAGHSRLPVYRGDLDDPVGFVHIKDLVAIVAAEEKVPDTEQVLPSIMRKLLYAPPSMPVAELLLRMQAQRIHMALVIDEFGGTDGLVTIEDLIEEIVGDIRDEHDEHEEVRLRQTSGGRWDSDARMELEDLVARLGCDLRLEEEEADTLGGLVFSLAGRVPLRGEVIGHPDGHEFEIADADPRRVRRVLIRLAEPASA